MRRVRSSISFSIILFTATVAPVYADDLQFVATPFEVRPPNSRPFTVGSSMSISNLDLTGKSISLDGHMKFDVSKKELENYVLKQTNEMMPLILKEGILNISSIQNLTITPEKDNVNIEADFRTNYSLHDHHVSLKIANKLLSWGSAQAVVGIVPHSVQIRFSDYNLLNSFESALTSLGTMVTGQGDINFMSENALQTQINKYLDKNGIRKYIPQVSEIRALHFGWSKGQDRVWVASRFTAEFDKKSVNSQLQALFDGAGSLGEGRSVAAGRPQPTTLEGQK